MMRLKYWAGMHLVLLWYTGRRNSMICMRLMPSILDCLTSADVKMMVSCLPDEAL